MAEHARPAPPPPWWQRPIIVGAIAAGVLAVVILVVVVTVGGGNDDEPLLSQSEELSTDQPDSTTPGTTSAGIQGLDITPRPPAPPITSTVVDFPSFLTSTLTDMQDRLPPGSTGVLGPGWEAVPAAPIAAREAAMGVWTGTEVIVWGGRGTSALADGAAYDPATGSWREIAASPLSARSEALAVWAGTEMIVLGGFDDAFEPQRDGAAYDPVSDSWRMLSPGFALEIDSFEGAAAWTGSAVFITGVRDQDADSDTWAYDPEADAFTALEPNPRRLAGMNRHALMTDAGLYVVQLDFDEDRGFLDWFDIDSGSWLANEPVPGLGAFDVDARDFVWIDPEMVVVGSFTDGVTYNIETGAVEPIPGSLSTVSWPPVLIDGHVFVGDIRFDPSSRQWLTDVAYPVPDAQFPTVVDIGNAAFIWGGGTCGPADDCDAFEGTNEGLIWGTPFPDADEMMPPVECDSGEGEVTSSNLDPATAFGTIEQAIEAWWANGDGAARSDRALLEERWESRFIFYTDETGATRVVLRLDLLDGQWRVAASAACPT